MLLDTFLLAAPVIFLAHTVSGMTGFGAAMVAVPVLVQFMPLAFAVPLVLLFDLVCTVLIGASNWRCVAQAEIKRLFPWLLLGIALGVTLLRNAGAHWPLMLLGVFVLAVCARGLYSMRRSGQPEPLAARWAPPFGVGGGIFSALFGTGGPVYTIYLSRRLTDFDQFRATIAVIILASGVVRVVTFAAVGLYAQPLLLSLAAALLPVALLGLFVGSRYRSRVPRQRMQQVIYALLAVAGAGAFYRGWVSPA